MASLVALVVALLVIKNASAECFDENGLNANESVCIPGHWNIAQVKSATIIATSTCGNPPSTACRLKPLNGCTKCNSSDPNLSHPARYIVDKQNGGAATYWQSETWWTWYDNGNTNDDLKVNITLNFNKSFDATGLLTLTFDSLRPYGMILEKSSDFGKTWTVLQYYASDCQTRFGMAHVDPTIYTPKNFNATCTEHYSKFQPQQGGLVLFDFKTRYNEEAQFFDKDIQQYLFTTNFRFQLLYPGSDGLENGDKNQDILSRLYYAISDLSIIGRCRCNGHAAYCGYNNTIYGRNKCVDCMHFTDGIDCEKCLPLYNNRSWMPATSKYQPNPCEKCECHEHADSCVFNKTLNYGVCQDCKHHTTGHFCQECQDNFYRNVSLSIKHPEICLACDCFPEGILNNGSCNVTTGQCECRQNVTGRQCDQCADRYWGHRVDPIGYCEECKCVAMGTKNASLNCNQMTGQCDCKANIDQKTCSLCKDGFYRFPKTIVEDCLKCDCDYGGSSSGICEKVNGTCECRKNIQGTRCTVVPPGFFTGSFNYFIAEAEQSGGSYLYTANTEDLDRYFTGTGYAMINPGQYITFKITSNETFNGYLLLRYSDVSHDKVPLLINVTALCDGGIENTLSVTGLKKGKGQKWMSTDPIKICKGEEFTFNVFYSDGAALNSSVKIDSLVLYPDIKNSRTYEVAEREGSANGYDVNTIIDCWNNWTTLIGARQSQPVCKNISFSAMAQVLDGALPCGCNGIGSESSDTCNPNGGQCQCKPGVTGRTCDRCMPGYYNFTSTGCTACNCNDTGSHHLVCDAITGLCPCKPGVVNRICDRCNHTYYGFNTGNGCTECKCNASGSVDLQCDSVTGDCPCKNSTAGQKCDQCRHGYYNYSTDGCRSCHCDNDGSSTLQCDLQSGECKCKANVEGFKCDKCKEGFFNRDSINPTGCTPCYCYERSSNCTSAEGYIKSFIELNPLTWSPDKNILNLVKNSRSITVSYAANTPASFQLISKRVLLNSYAQLFSFELKLSPLVTLNDNLSVYFEPSNGKRSLEFMLSPKPSPNISSYSVVLHEANSVSDITAKEVQESLSFAFNVKLKMTFSKSLLIEIVSAKLGTAIKGDNGEYAGNVENCTCNDANYAGLSCELCSRGYTRVPSDSKKGKPDPPAYSTACELCSCTNRSKECDGETGECKECRTGSEGYFCDQCQPGVDNSTDCNRCWPGFYGLYLKKFNGCDSCNCLLSNTLYGNQSICDLGDGQCTCKANITGRRCDRCHENAYNNTQGQCIDCPVCFRLLQVFVHELRSNISTVESAILHLRNGGSGDATFEKKLKDAEHNIRSLVQKASNSSTIEKDLQNELHKLNQTLDDMETLLNGKMTSDVTSLEGVVAAGSRDRNRTEELIKMTEKLVSDAYDSLNSSSMLISQASQSHDYLRNSTTVFDASEKQAIDDARRQNRTGEEILGETNTAQLLVQEANLTSLQTMVDHEKNNDLIHQLQLQCDTIKNLGLHVKSTASSLLKNSTSILINAKNALNDVQALDTNNQAHLQQVLATAKSLSDNTTVALTAIKNFNHEYNTLRQDIETSVQLANLLTADVQTISDDAVAVLNEARRAKTEAEAAVASAAKTHRDAKEMLQILETFETKANDSQNLAAKALDSSKEANRTSLQAISYSQEINASIQAALLVANQGLNVATTARDLAKKENQDVTDVYDQATALKSQSDSTKHTPEKFNVIKTNVTDIDTQIKPAIAACKENYTRYATDAREKSIKALNDATKASDAITNAKESIDSINKEFSKLQEVNVTRLRELQGEVSRLRSQFVQKDVSNLNNELQQAKETQQKFIDDYKNKVNELRRQVNEMKGLRDSLKSISPPRGCT